MGCLEQIGHDMQGAPSGRLDSFSMGRIRSDRNHGGMALAELDHPPLPESGNIHGSV